jgi:hypothetical protein
MKSLNVIASPLVRELSCSVLMSLGFMALVTPLKAQLINPQLNVEATAGAAVGWPDAVTSGNHNQSSNAAGTLTATQSAYSAVSNDSATATTVVTSSYSPVAFSLYGTASYTASSPTPGFNVVAVSVVDFEFSFVADASQLMTATFTAPDGTTSLNTDFGVVNVSTSLGLFDSNNPGSATFLLNAGDTYRVSAQYETSITTGNSTTTQDGQPGSFSFSLTTDPVPEPSTYAMLIGGLGLLAFWQKRRTRVRI